MKILKARVAWTKPRIARVKQSADRLTEEEAANVRRAIRQLQRRYGSLKVLSVEMGLKPGSLSQAMTKKGRRPTAGYAVRAARIARVSVADVLSGAWPKEGACPHCGRF